MNPVHVVKKPLLSEKGTHVADLYNRHSFLVSKTASRDEIKAAIEELYGVRVLGVNTMVRKGKRRRLKYGYVQESPTKKAVVKLHPDDTIELF